jgi:hypothetical protein
MLTAVAVAWTILIRGFFVSLLLSGLDGARLVGKHLFLKLHFDPACSRLPFNPLVDKIPAKSRMLDDGAVVAGM